MRPLLGVVAVLFGSVGAVLHALNAADGRVIEPSFWLLSALGAVAFGATGGLLSVRGRAPALSAVMLGIGLGQGVGLVSREYALLGAVPLDGVILWIGSWLWAPSHLAIGALLPLLLPDGSLPSPRWRPAMLLAAVALMSQSLTWALAPYHRQDVPFDVRGLKNPIGVDAATHPAVANTAAGLTLCAVLLALASLTARWHKAVGEDRQQLKWLGVGGVAAVLLFAAGLLIDQPAGEFVAATAVLPLPLTAGVAALRHRLWDVDIVVSAGLRFAVLSAVVIVVYVTVVSLLGAMTGAPVIATAVVALVLMPLHGRVQRWVNEWVHGEPEDPLTALTRLGEQLEATSNPADFADRLLPRVATRIADLLRSPYVAIELADGGLVEHGDRSRDIDMLPLTYAGGDVGRLMISSRDRSRSEKRRLHQLAAQAAVAVHSVLLAREARRSRGLVVSAREEERRRLRRDLHDQLGPVIAALALQAETARDLVEADPRQATALLDRLVPRLNGAVSDVRALVNELRPPTLDEFGLAGAVRELAARFRGPSREVDVAAGDLGDLPAAVELAAYRIVAEALSNAVRHGRPNTVTVDVRRTGTQLRVQVCDDGIGLNGAATPGLGLASMRQRAEELDGTWSVSSGSAGRGATVTATLPLALVEDVGRVGRKA